MDGRSVQVAVVVQMQVFRPQRAILGAFADVLRDAVEVRQAQMQAERLGKHVVRERAAGFALAEDFMVQADHMVRVGGHRGQVVADHDLRESAFFSNAPQKLAADLPALDIDS